MSTGRQAFKIWLPEAFAVRLRELASAQFRGPSNLAQFYIEQGIKAALGPDIKPRYPRGRQDALRRNRGILAARPRRVTVSLTEAEYQALARIAEAESRAVADVGRAVLARALIDQDLMVG